MLAPFVLTLALASLGTPAPAELRDPPGEWAPPAAAPEGPAPDSGGAGGWEWGVGLVVGRRSGWWSPGADGDSGFGWALEGALLERVGERFAIGVMLSAGAGLGAHVQAGARFPLSIRHRLDLLADAGFTRQELGMSDDYLAPTFGGRAGITWARPEGGGYVTIGLAMRHLLPDRTVQLPCGTGEPCGSAELGGGTIVGAFLTVGRAHLRGR